ncbi:rhamnulokinase family protein [Streptomyces sp. ST2-7A]|uniref:rhamnulokinase n=1 Tax=Streptomyces sp. ST2-7A TaxID=2907214 RepID=UPI001F46F631|nr:rhamnulokinase family protein [Streptomyces sp. ST2-7A]MCE7079313.1 rhamnulokinase [Streptomyces sp. ST2-7A]
MSGTTAGSRPGASPRGGAFAAVDLGASSGRVMLVTVGPDRLDLREVHRFPNRPVRMGDTLYWDIPGLYRGVLDGLREAGRAAGGRLDGVGIDSWAVDHGLLDADGVLLGNPVHYRDARVEGTAEKVAALLPPERLYAATGLQHLPFNTIYQLTAARGSAAWSAARRVLLIPDLISYWLTGEAGTELTNASTTQLIDPRTRDWSREVADALDLDPGLFPPLRRPGDPAGELLPHVLAETALAGPVPVIAVGSHDTASAVVGVPAAGDGPGSRFGYIATGTWSLAGLELPGPVLSEESRLANFTNELGVDGTVRYLRNIMGLWLLQECLRAWESEDGAAPDLAGLLADAERAEPLRSVVDAGDEGFIAPGDMPARIAAACRDTGWPVPRDRAETVRCVLDSLALAHHRALAEATRLADRRIEVVHVVGGGARNDLLCRLTAEACGLPVVAGPAEAAALGNALVQARAAGVLEGDLGDLRALLRTGQPLRHHEPRDGTEPWRRAEERLHG